MHVKPKISGKLVVTESTKHVKATKTSTLTKLAERAGRTGWQNKRITLAATGPPVTPCVESQEHGIHGFVTCSACSDHRQRGPPILAIRGAAKATILEDSAGLRVEFRRTVPGPGDGQHQKVGVGFSPSMFFGYIAGAM